MSLMNTLVVRNATGANATANPYLQVVCAWPVSGQYGLGSRILYVPLQNPNAIADTSRYYVLVAACVFARNVKWLRKACLAATLLFPAVAALHGIVLAAVPTDGEWAIDVMLR